jgi:hypothetical protein
MMASALIRAPSGILGTSPRARSVREGVSKMASSMIAPNFTAAMTFISSCSFPDGINTYGSTSGATMEVVEPRPYSSTKDCGIYGVSNSVWWKVTVGPYALPSYLYGGWSDRNAFLRLSTGGSSFDTVLAVYKGTSLTTLQQHYCSNTNALSNWPIRCTLR